MAIQPIPDGYHTVTPYLTIRNASDASVITQKRPFMIT